MMNLNSKSKKISARPFLFFLILLLLSIGFVARAQFASTENLSLRIEPPHPQAFEKISAQISSSKIDLKRSVITWSLNDETINSGIGEDEIVFEAGGVGSILRLKVVVEDPGGQTISRSQTLRPNDLSILWSAHSYTPPFYRGRSLPASQGLIIFTGIPNIISNGKRLSPSQLVYTWSTDGIVLGRASGVGKDTLVLESKPIPRGRTTITLSVSSFDKKVTMQETAEVRTQDPRIIFYEKHPLEGILYRNSLYKKFNLHQDELVIRGEPYFFSLDDISDDELVYQWFLNNKIILSTSEIKNEIILKKEGGGSGEVNLELKIDNYSRVLQYIEETLSITY